MPPLALRLALLVLQAGADAATKSTGIYFRNRLCIGQLGKVFFQYEGEFVHETMRTRLEAEYFKKLGDVEPSIKTTAPRAARPTNVSHFGSLWLVGRIFVQMAVAATSRGDVYSTKQKLRIFYSS